LGLRLTLQDGDKVLLDLPLSNSDWAPQTRDAFLRELEEMDSERICEICDFFSNRRRLEMVTHMVSGTDNSATFTELLRVAVNPKYISDLVNRAPRSLVTKDQRGYRVSPAGVGSFLLLSLGTSKVLEQLDSVKNGDKSFEEE